MRSSRTTGSLTGLAYAKRLQPTRTACVLVRPSESRSESVTGVVPRAGSVTANAPLASALQACQVPVPTRSRQRA